MSKSIAIIGGGVAGLSAGCYGRMNGYETRIFESHNIPGGLCTGWKRKGFVFDGCIHWLMGSAPESPFNRVWRELGMVKNLSFVEHEIYIKFERDDGEPLLLYADPEKLRRHMTALAPEDAGVIRELTDGIRKLRGVSMLPDAPTLKDMSKMFAMMGALGVFKKLGGLSVAGFGARFQNEFLRGCFTHMYDFADFPITILMMSLAAMSLRTAGYPIGGSRALADNLHRRYLDLGGAIEFGTRVRKILTEGDTAVGVELQDGTQVRADCIISAADGHSTIFDMLDGRFLSDELRGYYGGGLQPWPGLVQVSLGVARSFPRDTQLVRFHSRKPVIVAGKEERHLGFRHFSDDPTMAPAGKTVVEMMFSTDYAYWKEVAADKERYKAEKARIAEQVIEALEDRYPGFRNSVEEVDVATPTTFERYTRNWKGSFEGWLITTKNLSLILKGGALPKALPGLRNFSMIGQWTVVGGGLPPAAKDGRDIIKGMCKSDGKRFVTTEA